MHVVQRRTHAAPGCLSGEQLKGHALKSDGG